MYPSLAIEANQGVDRIQNVELLEAGKMKVSQDETAPAVQLSEKQPSAHAIAFKVVGV